MARFYSNENFPLPAVAALCALGHDVLTSKETGNTNKSIPDVEVLAFATAQGRCLLTQDKDFFEVHRQTPEHAGIVHCTLDVNFKRLASNIHAEVQKHAELNAKLLKVYRGHSI